MKSEEVVQYIADWVECTYLSRSFDRHTHSHRLFIFYQLVVSDCYEKDMDRHYFL